MRHRLGPARLVVRVAGSASQYLRTAQQIDRGASADDSVLSLTLRQPKEETAALVSMLVQAGASVEEVRPDVPSLEDAYLALVEGGS